MLDFTTQDLWIHFFWHETFSTHQDSNSKYNTIHPKHNNFCKQRLQCWNKKAVTQSQVKISLSGILKLRLLIPSFVSGIFPKQISKSQTQVHSQRFMHFMASLNTTVSDLYPYHTAVANQEQWQYLSQSFLKRAVGFDTKVILCWKATHTKDLAMVLIYRFVRQVI